MSKAILILDNMPDRCGHCRLAVMQRCYPICAVTGLQCVEGKPEWCPLKEAPERYKYEAAVCFNSGYNTALKDMGMIDK